ncbi:hypothetical protein [Histophilus somni]|uniref:hypothetical protein n=1 Tax=Histophilus somni TaxID=731 RepID=UPI00201F67AE|nr:hypothetical protein [Histophilus somni]
MKRLRKLSVLAFVAMFATGCATIVSKRDYNVSIQSNPSNAYFVIKNRAGKVITSGKHLKMLSYQQEPDISKAKNMKLLLPLKVKMPKAKLFC